jgi:hypothetical protein
VTTSATELSGTMTIARASCTWITSRPSSGTRPMVVSVETSGATKRS